MKNKRLLVLDANNNFIRSYIVNPALSHNGDPIGGLLGSLQTLQKFIRETRPDQVVICWDGPGGSTRRRQMNKEYKMGRKPIRLNRSLTVSSGVEEENKSWQMGRLFEYYECMPVYQFIFDGVEADDLIAYIVQMSRFENWEKIIVSSDKDMIQLLDNKTLLYRPTQAEILNTKRVVEKYGIHPNNFTLARSMDGDKSDGLRGIEGVGLKTVAKRIDGIGEEKRLLIDDLIWQSKKNVANKTKIKLYSLILENIDLIKKNYSIMQLGVPDFSIQDKNMVKEVLEKKKFLFKKTTLISMMIKDEIEETGFSGLFQYCLIRTSKSNDTE
jgi:5'-3' exonuclease